MAIDLNFTEEQQLLQDSARGFLETYSPISLTREYDDSDEDFPKDLWGRMAEQGWMAMPFAEEYGGFESSLCDCYVLYHELGRQLTPSPYLETVGIAGPLIAALGTEDQKSHWLAAIGSGEAVLTLALVEPDGAEGPDAIRVSASEQQGEYRLSGEKVLVAYAGSADRILCVARVDGDGIAVFFVDPEADGVTVEKTPSVSGLPIYSVILDNAPGELLGTAEDAWPVIEEQLARAAVMQAAMVVGAGERVLEMTVEYAQTRVQFGQPIGKHQAVQYLCTDIATKQHFTRLLVLHAIWRIDSGRSFLREASLAKAAASEAAAEMTRAAHEVHAGIGFIVDYDLQLYTRRAKHWEFNLGDARHHLDRALELTLENLGSS